MVSLKMLKSPHKEIYSFIFTMLCFSLYSSLYLAKYFYQYASTTVAYRRCYVCHVELILRCASKWVSGNPPNAKTRRDWEFPQSESEERKERGMFMKKGLGDNSTYCFKQHSFSPEARNILHKETRVKW